MYEKGIQTRNHLYQTTKQLFYTRGYESTKIKDIVEIADTPIGLFTYYFKTKDNIVHEIYAVRKSMIFSRHLKLAALRIPSYVMQR